MLNEQNELKTCFSLKELEDPILMELSLNNLQQIEIYREHFEEKGFSTFEEAMAEVNKMKTSSPEEIAALMKILD